MKRKSREKLSRELKIRLVLTLLVLATMVRSIFAARSEHVFMCVLTLILFAVPIWIEKKLAIDIPPRMEGIIYCFIFAAEILGEINSFYIRIPYWDTILHTITGFLVAAIGFSLVELFNRSKQFQFELSPLFLAIVAFCFSMTVGVLWEFFEFSMDYFWGMDMQKDTIVQTIHSVLLNPDGTNTVVNVPVESIMINGEDWMQFPGGYVDIGIIDTMKDLFVNFIGALVFSIIGYFHVKSKGKSKFAASFIPVVHDTAAGENAANNDKQAEQTTV